MNWTPYFWAIDAALMALLILQLAHYRLGRRARRATDREEHLGAIEDLREGPLTDTLTTAWEFVAVETPLTRWPADNLTRAILALQSASDEWVDLIRKESLNRVNKLNEVCELIDEDMLRPIDLVKTNVDLHAALLHELSLLEPFIWHQAIFGGRGRWGFRPLQLLDALRALRAISPTPTIRRPISFAIDGQVLYTLPEITPSARLRELVGARFAPRRITVRTKIRQNALRNRLVDQVREVAGDLLPERAHVVPIEW